MDLFSFPTPLVKAKFLKRLNRFVSHFQLASGELVAAHSPNTGSMKGLLVSGAPALLWDSQNPSRKYPLSWKAVFVDGIWVGIDTAFPNQITCDLIAARQITSLPALSGLAREKSVGAHSRIDIFGYEGETPWFIEVKNVTLAHRGTARFPDAVTARGLKHLHELDRLMGQGAKAAMVYVIQREDCERFQAAEEIDPAYALQLREVHSRGVLVIPLLFSVSQNGLKFEKEIPYEPDAGGIVTQ
ncbi:DNA/RNA nuclease SfsA [Myxococcota bacterium]|nr:DNA/RNA nuclease SfsA [Myxococcota bacterium]